MKSEPVHPRQLAIEDIEAAIDWYVLEAGAQAAAGFVDELQAAFVHVGRNPGSGSPRHAHELDIAGLRSWPMTRYPYLLFYFEQAQHIEVWRVLHGNRDLPAWLTEPPSDA